ncbi:universal stress protein [Zooshikella marina]|uniref:universal stress protein n=1 Tax=Zooshikella ganghwensis TaxID=202772 RepID=UPI0003FE96A7|nr:universal stress protein [Zooshikella ganghwensis]MBU2704865.1 universal stress protein [Zooshikella ganghwensis]
MYKKILLPLNMNETALIKKALAAAISEAKAHNATLHLFSSIPGFNMPMVSSYFPKDVMLKALTELKQKLKDYAQANIPEDINVTIGVGEGSAHKQILKEIEKENIDLVVISSHSGRKVGQFFLGSVASKIVEHAKTNVMVIKE